MPDTPLDEWIEVARQAIDREGSTDWDITPEVAEAVATKLWNYVSEGLLPLPSGSPTMPDTLTRWTLLEDVAVRSEDGKTDGLLRGATVVVAAHLDAVTAAVRALPAQPYTMTGMDTTTDSRMVNRAVVLAILGEPRDA